MKTNIHPPHLRVLAADIGGTQARFAEVRVDEAAAPVAGHHSGASVEVGPVFVMDTRQAGVSSFSAFWKFFQRNAPPELADTETFDAVALALAGAVAKDSAVLPNIDWDIKPAEVKAFPNLFLLNDFIAQGHALTAAGAFSRMDAIRPGEEFWPGALAMVGAGTGLGHCALISIDSDTAGGRPRWHVLGSEAGHAGFAFQGETEHAIEREWLKRAGKDSLSNDDVVSGSGAVMLHSALTGTTVTAGEALGGDHPDTVNWFSRFYGRACRHYCLAIYPVRALVLSGGIALRHPHLVRSDAFRDSFNDAAHYRGLMARIPIWLNTDPQIGIRGAALYAASNMSPFLL